MMIILFYDSFSIYSFLENVPKIANIYLFECPLEKLKSVGQLHRLPMREHYVLFAGTCVLTPQQRLVDLWKRRTAVYI